jgi:DNA (cytosine-5)-methyltransferase 1
MQAPAQKHTMISLFAGAGGLDIGLEMAGFTTQAINELEPHACETLRQNKHLSQLSPDKFDTWFDVQMQQRCYSNISTTAKQQLRTQLRQAVGQHQFLQHAQVLEGDIRGISSTQLLQAAHLQKGEPTLVAGGPPCQPFSRAGKRETVETDDGKLFLEFVRVVQETQPRWFLFENVKGLMQSRTLVPYIRCPSCLNSTPMPFRHRSQALTGALTSASCPKCAYQECPVEVEDVRGGSLDIVLHEFRNIGYTCYHQLLNAADYGVPQSRERLIIVGSRDGEAFKFPPPTHCERKQLDNHVNSRQLDLLSGVSSSLRPWTTVQDVLRQQGHPEFGQLDIAKAVIWVKNVVRPHDEPVYWSLNRPSPTVGAHQAAKLALAPDGVPPEQLVRQQWHVRGHRQKDLPPVDVKHAYLSDTELLTLQTFPADWYLYGTRMQRAFQIGNAVPPRLAQAVGQAILQACERTQHTQ